MNLMRVFKQAGCANTVHVLVQELKHNSLRGDTYWVTREVKVCKNHTVADNYVKRVERRIAQTL